MPTILHEHANLTDTPWFQKVADSMLEPLTDIAIAVSQSTADFVIEARQMPAGQSQGRLSRRAARRVQPRAHADEIAAARRELGIAPDDFAIGTVTRLHDSKGNSYLVDAARAGLDRRPARAVLPRRRRAASRRARGSRRARSDLGDRFVFAGFAQDVARVVSAFDVSVFPSLWEGTPLTVFEALAMGKADRRDRRRRPLDVLTHDRDALIVPKRERRRAGRPHRPHDGRARRAGAARRARRA